MKPLAYVDFILSEAGDMAIPVLAGKVLGIFHRVCSLGHITYAMSFPRMLKTDDPAEIFGTFRFFGETKEDLADLVKKMKNDFLIRDYTIVGRPRSAPESSDTWVSFTRFRIPKEIRSGRLNNRSREYRYNLAASMPFIPCFSSSTQQNFRIYIETLTEKTQKRWRHFRHLWFVTQKRSNFFAIVLTSIQRT